MRQNYSCVLIGLCDVNFDIDFVFSVHIRLPLKCWNFCCRFTILHRLIHTHALMESEFLSKGVSFRLTAHLLRAFQCTFLMIRQNIFSQNGLELMETDFVTFPWSPLNSFLVASLNVTKYSGFSFLWLFLNLFLLTQAIRRLSAPYVYEIGSFPVVIFTPVDINVKTAPVPFCSVDL